MYLYLLVAASRKKSLEEVALMRASWLIPPDKLPHK
jgi:hypothetical protein